MGQFMGEQMAASRAVRLEFTIVENDIRAHRERPCANGSGGLGCDAIGMNFYPAEIMAKARFKMAANGLGKCLAAAAQGRVDNSRYAFFLRCCDGALPLALQQRRFAFFIIRLLVAATGAFAQQRAALGGGKSGAAPFQRDLIVTGARGVLRAFCWPAGAAISARPMACACIAGVVFEVLICKLSTERAIVG